MPYRNFLGTPHFQPHKNIPMSVLSDENRYKILKLLESNPELNQRQVAVALGISLGKTNYCLKALIEKGLIKAGKFRRKPSKGSYAYFLTPKGFDEKAKVTIRFLQRKKEEFSLLQQELEELRVEVSQLSKQDPRE